MSTTTNTANAITNASKNQISSKKTPNTIKDYVKLYSGEITKALPSVLTAERFTRMVTTALTKTPKLAECTPQSFVGAMLTAAQLGLEPNTPLGQAYLIPYGKECQFQIGYKGLIDLCYRSGEFKSISAHIVYENDDFEFEYGLEEDKLKHRPCMCNRGNPAWVYAVYRLKDGGYGFEVMSVDECLAFGKKYSKTFKNGAWQTAPEEMMKKTMLKRVLKYAPIRSDFITKDSSVAIFNTDNSEDDAPPIEYVNAEVIETTIINEDNIQIDNDTGEVIE